MFEKLNKLLNNSHSPYSNFKVSAIAIDKDKNSTIGVNVESASFSNTICAERNAIFNAVSNNFKWGNLSEVHILAKGKKTSKSEFVTPCGNCRQIIFEASNGNAKVYLYNLEGKQKVFDIKTLLPEAFIDNKF